MCRSGGRGGSAGALVCLHRGEVFSTRNVARRVPSMPGGRAVSDALCDRWPNLVVVDADRCYDRSAALLRTL